MVKKINSNNSNNSNNKYNNTNIRRKISNILLKILVLGMIISMSSNYGSELGELQHKPEIIHPGDDVDVWIKFTNPKDNPIKNIEISIKPHYPFEIKQVNPIKGVSKISHLNEGESDIAYFKLHVNENTPSSDYRVDITVKYTELDKVDGEIKEINHEYTEIKYLPVYGTGNFEITVGKINGGLIPSKTVQIPLNIINKGTGTTKQTTITIGGNNLISPVGTTKFYVGTIKPGQKNTIYVNIHTNEQTPENSYLAPLTIKWIDEDGTPKTENINVGLVVQGEVLLDVSNVITTPKEIKPGDTSVRLDVTITNNGHGRAKDIVGKLILNNSIFKPSWSSSDIKSLGALSGSEQKTVSYYIDVDKYTKPGTYNIPLKIEYYDIFNNKHNITKNVEIYVKSKPIIEVVPGTYKIHEGTNEIKIKVKNIGNTKAESVKISAIKNSAQPFDFDEKTDYVGTLYPGEEGVGIIKFNAKNLDKNNYKLTVELRCVGNRDDGDDNVYIKQESVDLVVDNSMAEPDISPSVIGVIVLILIIVGGIFINKIKSKSKKNKGDNINN